MKEKIRCNIETSIQPKNINIRCHNLRENNILARKYSEEKYWNGAGNSISEIYIICTDIILNGKYSVGRIIYRKETLEIRY